MATAYCNKCSSHRPIDRFGKLKNGGLKAQCKDCRNQHEKDSSKWKKDCKQADAIGTDMPPAPEPSKSSRPVGGLNDNKCDICHVSIKTQNLKIHKECVHKDHVCPQCAFVSDCFGQHMHHMELAHSVSVPRPIKCKDVYMCQAHKKWNVGIIKKKCYQKPEQKAKAAEWRANAPLARQLGVRKRNAVHDHSAQRQEYLTSNPHIKSQASAAYESQPLRKYQKRFQEKSVSIRNLRIQWRYENYDKVRDIWRKYHDTHRETRNLAAAQYALGNAGLKVTKIVHGAVYRGIGFSLVPEYAAAMLCMPCFYCNTPPEDASKVGLCGIDRVDNGMEYTPDNCVPCCARCNVMKNSISVTAYLSQLHKIHSFLHMDTLGAAELQEEAQFEDHALSWNNGVRNDILTNVGFIKFVLNSALPTAVFTNNRAREEVRRFLEWVRDDMADVLPDDFDSQSELGRLVVADKLQYVRDALNSDIYALLDDMADKRAAVEYVAKHEWRLTDEEVVAIMYKSQCVYCGFAGDLGIDRLDSGGNYIVGNVVPACHTCNITKNCIALPAFLNTVRNTMTTLGMHKSVNVADAITKRAAQLGLTQFVFTRRVGERTNHFGVDLRPQSSTRRMWRVTEEAVVYQYSDKRTQITYHAHPCGREDMSKCRRVKMVALRSMFDSIVPCKRCVTTDASAQDCADMELDIPWLEFGERLCVGRRVVKGALRAEDTVLTDVISGMYHTLVHSNHKFSYAVMPLQVALQVNDKLVPCKKCVSENVEDGVFEGVSGCPRLTTLQECRDFAEKVREELREYNRGHKTKSRGSIIPKSVPGDTVLMFAKTTAKTYHTTMHHISGRPGEDDEASWLSVPRLGLKRGTKPCSLCCSSL